jgi:hypothetical protein
LKKLLFSLSFALAHAPAHAAQAYRIRRDQIIAVNASVGVHEEAPIFNALHAD